MAITDPLDITDCVLWLDATDNTKYTYDHMSVAEETIVNSWGTGNIKQNPYILNTWIDKSVAGNDVTVPTGGEFRPQGGEFRPQVLINNGINGKNSVYFDGYDVLAIPDNIITFGNFSIFIVGQSNNGSNTEKWGGCILGTGNHWDEVHIMCLRGGNFLFRAGIGNDGDAVRREIPGDTYPHLFSLQSLGQYIEGRIDGIGIGVGKTSVNTPIANISLGSSQTEVGIGTNKERFYDGFLYGKIAEVIFYNRAINESERLDIEGYLNTKWGLPANPSYSPIYD